MPHPMRRGRNGHFKRLVESLKGGDHFEKLGVDWRMALEFVLK